jgi:hypothetical protein
MIAIKVFILFGRQRPLTLIQQGLGVCVHFAGRIGVQRLSGIVAEGTPRQQQPTNAQAKANRGQGSVLARPCLPAPTTAMRQSPLLSLRFLERPDCDVF